MISSCFAVVVVYNKSCQDSLTCRNLLHMDDPELHVVIYDNSTTEYNNRKYCEDQNWGYLGGDGNKGLSVAYNQSVAWICENNGTGWVCLFDDDTQIDAGYFEQLRKCAQKSNSEILVPLIYSGETLISPCRIDRGRHKIKLFESEEKAMTYMESDITAINSGMAIRTEVISRYRYDEHIFLDGIDHKFTADMITQGCTIDVIPYSCNHEFSGNSKPSFESARSRFRIFVKDMRYIYRDRISIFWRLAGKRALKLTIVYKNFEFIRLLLKNS